jgi:hypothetical protein
MSKARPSTRRDRATMQHREILMPTDHSALLLPVNPDEVWRQAFAASFRIVRLMFLRVTRDEVMRRAGLSRRQLVSLTHGEGASTASALRAFLEAFDVDPRWFLRLVDLAVTRIRERGGAPRA